MDSPVVVTMTSTEMIVQTLTWVGLAVGVIITMVGTEKQQTRARNFLLIALVATLIALTNNVFGLADIIKALPGVPQ